MPVCASKQTTALPCSGFSAAAPARPKASDLMEGAGGVRKLRWGGGTQGKSGGVRVICYVHSDLMPLYLLTLFAKNEKANINKAECNALAGLVELLVQIWLESSKEHL